MNSDVLRKQATQKLNFDRRSKPRLFSVGQSVMVRVHRSNTKWSRGIIINQLGPVTYGVDVQGHVVKCHVDQLRGCPESVTDTGSGSSELVEDNFVYPDSTPANDLNFSDGRDQPPTPRYPQRIRQPPDRFRY